MSKNIFDLLCMTQAELYTHIVKEVKPNYVTDTYMVYRKNHNPKPLLCVHLDTINTRRYEEPLSITNFVLDDLTIKLAEDSNLSCLGGDDRAGVWIALEVIKYMERTGDYRYDVGFFTDEESGGIGSAMYRRDVPIDNNTCYIGLDRRCLPHQHEVALYGYDNDILTQVFNDAGYKTVMGSFTDASNIAGSKACINLSVGYNREHTRYETLHIPSMQYTLETLCIIDIPDMIFYSDDGQDDYYGYGTDYDLECEVMMDENKAMREYLWTIGVDPQDIIDDYYGHWFGKSGEKYEY